MNIKIKESVQDLAYFGGSKLLSEPKSTSSLVQPDYDNFLQYSKQFFNRQFYTNNGVLVQLLEKRLAEFHQAEFCITVCSGFWALALAMTSLAIKGKQEIIMPSLTYRRMADIAAWACLKPRFCEVDPQTLAVSSNTVSACINDQTALVLAVHPIVNCCDIEGIVQLGVEHEIPVLFDSVESMYESENIGKVGKFGDAECFSMHASKLLNGFEGGYITTNDSKLTHKLKRLRTFGFEGPDNCTIPGGLNAKLNEVHAAMALANLDVIEQVVVDNKKRYMQYRKQLSRIPSIRLLEFDEKYKTSYKNIVVELLEDWSLDRNKTVALLNGENILARVYYYPPLHQKPMSYPFVPATLKDTDQISSRFMLLPCGDFVTTDDIDDIVELLAFIHVKQDEIKKNIERKEDINHTN